MIQPSSQSFSTNSGCAEAKDFKRLRCLPNSSVTNRTINFSGKLITKTCCNCKGSCFSIEWTSYVTPYNGLQVLSFQNNQMRFTWATFSLKIDLISLTPSSSRVDRCWPHLLCLACLTRARTRWGNNHRQAIGTKRLGCEPKVVVLLLGNVSSRSVRCNRITVLLVRSKVQTSTKWGIKSICANSVWCVKIYTHDVYVDVWCT